MPSVFLSYAHDSAQHRAEVGRLAEFLRERGVVVMLDRWSDHERQDWSSWAIKGITEADFVVVVASPNYRRAGDGLGASAVNRGVQSETALLRDLLHGDRQTWLRRILPVLLPGHDVDEIPAFLQPHTGSYYRVTAFTEEGASDLIRTIRGNEPEDLVSDARLVPLSAWQRKAYVNHDLLFGADDLVGMVSQAMAHEHVDRVVSVVGEGGVGKTAVAYEAVRVAVERRRFTRVAWSSASDPHVGGNSDGKVKAQEYWIDIVKDLGDQLGFDLGLSRALWVREFRRHVGSLNADERLLLVVDNLETLPGATDAINQLREMGVVAPHVILVTTRWELRPHLPGVVEYRVRPLDTTDSMRMIRHLGMGDPALSSATEMVLTPVLLVTEGNPFLIKLLVQQYLSSHRPLDHVLYDLRQLRDEHELSLGHRVRSYLYTGSLTELERRHGEQNAYALLASFCVKGRGDAFGYDELAGVSGIENVREFGSVLTTACQMSIVTSFGALTRSSLDRHYTIHSLLYDFTCGMR